MLVSDMVRAFLLQILLRTSQPALFELLTKRPQTWPKFVPYAGEETSKLPGKNPHTYNSCLSKALSNT